MNRQTTGGYQSCSFHASGCVSICFLQEKVCQGTETLSKLLVSYQEEVCEDTLHAGRKIKKQKTFF